MVQRGAVHRSQGCRHLPCSGLSALPWAPHSLRVTDMEVEAVAKFPHKAQAS